MCYNHYTTMGFDVVRHYPSWAASWRRERQEAPSPYPTFDKMVADYQRRKRDGVGCYTQEGKVITFSPHSDVYNGVIVNDGDNDRDILRLYGRSDRKGELATHRAYDFNGTDWEPNHYEQEGWEDMKAVDWKGGIAFIGTHARPRRRNSSKVGSNYAPGYIYLEQDGTIQQHTFNLPTSKNLAVRVRQYNPDETVDLDFTTRIRKEERTHFGGQKIISCKAYLGSATVSDLSELDNFMPNVHGNRQYELDAGIPEGETNRWFGLMQLKTLKNGRIGVLGHDGRELPHGIRQYATTYREYRPNADGKWELVVLPMILSMAEDYQYNGGAKNKHVSWVHFGMNILDGTVDGKIVSSSLVGGINDKAMATAALSQSPYSADPVVAMNRLYTAKVSTLQAYGIPVKELSSLRP